MKPRHRAQMRLARHVPGVRECVERQPAVRMSTRESDTRPPRPIPGGSVKVPEEIRIKSLRAAKPGPYAPLLIRLVRSPYALRVAALVRKVDESRHRPTTLGREAFPNAVREAEELRATYRFVRPMREVTHSPELRPRPFARVRRQDPVEPIHFDPGAEEDWV